MEREYSYLKLRRIKIFRNNRAVGYFKKLESNFYEYKDEMIRDFEDKLHVFWSWFYLLKVSGFIFLILSILLINVSIGVMLFSISILSIAISSIMKSKLESIRRGYWLGLSIVNQLIKEQQDKIINDYNF